ncbi:hypothetical protein SAY87_031575 [Trapa incisa]|uniref:TLC domain-containing protein n=2 Tax=Trapa TaxID=22665 RepID=A0AAN7M389_TRANT|nr:hypothetical protein SAY87_031575 [Trapa incisa]KAK4797067.1 hypothetical protein SAY86_029393 [Trapa natans]
MEGRLPNLVPWGVVVWSSAFLFTRRSLPTFSFDFSNRLVSTVHAIVAVSLASMSVEDWSSPISPLASKPSPRQETALAVSLAYLIYDLFCCLFDKRVSVDNAVHHLVSIIGIGAGLLYGKCGSEQVAALWITEISSPFLHLRELLKELGYRDTGLNLAADVSRSLFNSIPVFFSSEVHKDVAGLSVGVKQLAFAATFSLARMMGGPYLTYKALSADNPLLIKAMAIGLQLVSAFWFYKIVRMLKYKLSKISSSPRKLA